MELGFLIDQRKCIGCHACTVACKSENEVPVGSFRTWVKYVEKGRFPAVRRHFTVLRCNHCDAAPCVEICPTGALSKRPDKIVDLDRDICIGCRSCMQACPYDALYLNEDSGVAEKCHYCAHRTELGLEPACVVVCPEEAIVSGDVSDPDSRIARHIAELPTSQRKLDKGTRPRVWYVDALDEALEPGATRQPDSWLWADRTRELEPAARGPADPEAPITTLNVDHQPVWGWHIWTYLLTKNVAAGAGLLAPFVGLLGLAGAGVWPEVVALVFLGVTGALLVHDLGRPERFLKILTHANRRSWLVIGTWILMGFGGLATLALILAWAGLPGRDLVRWINLPFAVLTSGYSAFLFAQCRGRDLWLEPGLFATLVARAALCGAVLGVLLAPVGATAPLATLAAVAVVNTVLALRERKHEPANAAARGARTVFGARRYARAVAGFAQVALAAVAILAIDHAAASLALRVLLAGAVLLLLFRLERAWIRAGQALPIS